MKNKKIYIKIIVFVLLIYVAYITISQQKTINSYKNEESYYKEQIDSKLAYKEILYQKKNNINSEKYIEEAAREKLDMYLPNEKVFIDTCKYNGRYLNLPYYF